MASCDPSLALPPQLYKLILRQINDSGHYKLFVDADLRRVVLNHLTVQLYQKGLISSNTTPQLALATGKIKSATDTQLLRDHFVKMGWRLFDTDWLVSRLTATADESYFDSVSHVVSKLILKNNTPTTA
jgi:hypothetical protein